MDKYDRKLKNVELEMRETLGKAQALTQRAADQGRGLDEAETVELKSYTDALDVLKGAKAEVEAAIATVARVNDLGSMIVDETKAVEAVPAHRAATTIGEAFTKSDGYRRMTAGGIQGRFSSGPVEIEGKTLLDSTGVGAESGGLIQRDIQPGILPILFQPLYIADVMASGTTSSSLIRYMVEKTATNGAAGVPESGLKPESTLEFDAVDAAVKKIATFLPVTDEMLEDVQALQSYVNARLSLFVRQEEERQLLDGSGGDELDGLIGQIPGGNLDLTSSVDNAQAADHIYAAITKVRAAFVEPDAIVMHPDDWEGVQLLKDEFGRYLGSGPFAAAQGPTLWGKRVVVTTAVDAGSAVVGAFASASQIFRRGGLSLEASNSHADFFQHNKTAIRCEERLVLAVYRPEAFATADVTAGS